MPRPSDQNIPGVFEKSKVVGRVQSLLNRTHSIHSRQEGKDLWKDRAQILRNLWTVVKRFSFASE